MRRPRFKLKPEPRALHRLARDYADDDREVEAIGVRVRKRGFVEYEELRVLGKWKSERSRRLIALNSPDLVHEVTRVALAAHDERLRIGSLMLLQGVAYPTASVILHLCHRDPYPILDFRALETLGVKQPSSYTFEFWWAYVTVCRELAEKHCGGDMRMLDRALWQWSAARR